MSERVIPLVDQRIAAHAATVPRLAVPATGLLADGLGRVGQGGGAEARLSSSKRKS